MNGGSADRADDRLPLRDGSAVRLCVVDLDGGATVHGGDRGAVTAVVEGRVVGRASYARVYGPRAELSLVVDDAYWPRGLAETLLVAIGTSAAGFGMTTFLMRVRASDVRLLALLREDFAARAQHDGAHVEIEFGTSP